MQGSRDGSWDGSWSCAVSFPIIHMITLITQTHQPYYYNTKTYTGYITPNARQVGWISLSSRLTWMVPCRVDLTLQMHFCLDQKPSMVWEYKHEFEYYLYDRVLMWGYNHISRAINVIIVTIFTNYAGLMSSCSLYLYLQFSAQWARQSTILGITGLEDSNQTISW